MTIGNLFSHPDIVQRQDLVLQVATKRPTTARVSSSSLVSRGSADSISSWTSSEITESDSVGSSGRRSIFSDYWKTSPLPSIPCQEDEDDDDDDQPRSPLLEHFPTRKEQLAATPPRRSIFGRAKSNSIGAIYNSHQNKLDLDNFFSKHEHMKVVSSSLQRRERSYSCSDASTTEKSKGPLASCLKRRSSELPNKNVPTDPTKKILERRPSVTFDSQIEIVAFEPTRSFEEAPSCLDGSWTDLFEG